MFTKFLLFFSFITASAFAHENAVPEFFFQAEDSQAVLQGDLGYTIINLEEGGGEADTNATTISGSVNYGLTHNFAVRLSIPYVANVKTKGTGFSSQSDSGFTDLGLDLLVHREIGSSVLYYGVESAITLDKTGTGPNFFSRGHSFNPYIGISKGDHCKYGAKLTYKTISTNSGSEGTLGDFNYDLEIFGEINNEDTYLYGVALGYQQISGSDRVGSAFEDDSLILAGYGRLYLEKFTLIPRISYTHNLRSEIDSQLQLNASLGIRKSF